MVSRDVFSFSRISLLSITTILIVTSFSYGRDVLNQLSEDIKTGPTLFYTPEAVHYYSRTGSAGHISFQDIEQAEKSFRALLELAQKGSVSSPALPVLIDRMPVGIHVTTVSATFDGRESFDDWVSSYLMNERNNFIFNPPFLDHSAVSRCEDFLEVTHNVDFKERRETGGEVRSAVVDIHIVFRLHIGEYALASVTGVTDVREPENWVRWWRENREQFQHASADPQLREYEKRDYIEGAQYNLTLVSKQNVEGVVNSVSDTAIVLQTDDARRFLLRREQIFTGQLVMLPDKPSASVADQTPKPDSTSDFGDLVNLSGKTDIMIRLTNGSILKGKFHSIEDDLLIIDIDGVNIPVRENVVDKISTPN
ncbi:hypothetical protein QA601_14225 [Chitinispirillales bacterium ANBcel5]|uniref:hypothetical protein n=1 Tax=Cellulosispirillum alkaliphilum TaxID=3039283 RepID=UPI002A505B9B|nr:hypothetical protein [Chitinispirillales bacterium ANBcel5]